MDGQVYSLAENFATAILVEDGLIAWIGSEGGAEVHMGDVDEVVDLHGGLVTPGFVNLASDWAQADAGFVHAASSPVPIADMWDADAYTSAGDQPLGVVPRDPCRLRSRIAIGAATALVPADPGRNGWYTIRAAVHEIEATERITARAAFSALTRGAWRLLGHPERGVLGVGAEATFVQWAPTDLIVETPDSRISNWSTDPRAATPGLPPMEPGEKLPVVNAVWHRGSRQ